MGAHPLPDAPRLTARHEAAFFLKSAGPYFRVPVSDRASL